MESLRGDLLRDASREYVTSLYLGVRCVLWSILLFVSMFIGLLFGAGFIPQATLASGPLVNAVNWSIAGLSLFSAGLGLFGWFKFTTPEPALHLVDQADRHRQWVRFLVIASAAQSIVMMGLQAVDPNIGQAPSFSSPLATIYHACVWLGIIIWGAQFLFSMNYLRWLAGKIPNHSMAVRATRFRWSLPLWFFPGLMLCGLGPVIAVILYYNFLNDFRKVLKKILNDPTFQPRPAAGR